MFEAPVMPPNMLPTIDVASPTMIPTIPVPWLTPILKSRITLVAEEAPARPGAAANGVDSSAFASPAMLFAILVPSSKIAPATFVTAPNKPLAIGEMAFASPSWAGLRMFRI